MNKGFYSAIIAKCSSLLLWIFAKALGNYHMSCFIIIFCDVIKIQKTNGNIIKHFQML